LRSPILRDELIRCPDGRSRGRRWAANRTHYRSRIALLPRGSQLEIDRRPPFRCRWRGSRFASNCASPQFQRELAGAAAQASALGWFYPDTRQPLLRATEVGTNPCERILRLGNTAAPWWLRKLGSRRLGPTMSSMRVSDGTESGLTITCWYTLARIHAWGLREWRPKTSRKPALIFLDDPQRSSMHPRVVEILLASGLLEDLGDDLEVTSEGVAVVQERPEMMQRMRSAGVI
jgi:hypothetical protein